MDIIAFGMPCRFGARAPGFKAGRIDLQQFGESPECFVRGPQATSRSQRRSVLILKIPEI